MVLFSGCKEPTIEEEEKALSYCKQDIESYVYNLKNVPISNYYDRCDIDFLSEICICGQYESIYNKKAPVEEILCTKENKEILEYRYKKSMIDYEYTLGLLKKIPKNKEEIKKIMRDIAKSFGTDVGYFKSSLNEYKRWCEN